MKQAVVARKNWLFRGSLAGGERGPIQPSLSEGSGLTFYQLIPWESHAFK